MHGADPGLSISGYSSIHPSGLGAIVYADAKQMQWLLPGLLPGF
jgi:hypothetical protein